ncbi:MAG: ATPase [Paracoccaceae bacterium]
MIYKSAQQWQDDTHKRVLLFGMSGLGKTHVSNMLRGTGDWFHYSIDYRIGTRYLGEHIVDNFKREAMQNPFLRGLLKTDSIHIGSNISFDNLEPLSTYLGKPGDRLKGGIEINEYMRRQALHERAEISALLDAPYFIDRAQSLYQYSHFICDSGGSICEVIDPDDADDPVLKSLSDTLLLVWIQGSEAHNIELARRFDKAPKPMCYRAEFLQRVWQEYLIDNKCADTDVDPDDFVRWAYGQALAQRQPRYAAMARNWGVTVSAQDVAKATTPTAFDAMIARALEKRPT